MAISRPSEASRIVGDRLKKARLAFGLSQEDLAKLVGQSAKTISSWENGDRLANPLAIAKFAEAYQIPTDYFWRGTLWGIDPDIRGKLAA